MSRNIDFIMNYPYFIYDGNAKYGYQSSETQVYLNDCNVWPYVFNNPIPRCVGFKIGIYAEKDNVHSLPVTNRNWYIYIYRQSQGWVKVDTVYVAEATWVYATLSFTEKTITKVVAVPSYVPSTSTQWITSLSLENLKFITNLNTIDLSANGYFKGVLANYYGLNSTSINELTVNVEGTLTKSKRIFVNIEGSLTEIPYVPSSRLQTVNKEDFAVFEFTPQTAGNFRFVIKQNTGDHDGWLYDSSFNLLNTDYFDNQSFTLSQGSVYYILLMQYYTSTTPADSVLQVIKEV